MPQATEELRRKWDGPDDTVAMQFLEDQGYRLLKNWTWLAPDNRNPSDDEFSAVLFLIQEWDFGGIVTCEDVIRAVLAKQPGSKPQ